MTKQYAVYKELISNMTILVDLKIHPGNTEQKPAGVAIFLSHQTDFRAKKITRDKGRHYIFDKGANSQRKHSNPTCIYSKQKAKTGRI